MVSEILYRMTFETYERMVDLGLLGPKDPIVLIDGLLVTRREKTPHCTVTLMRGEAAQRTSTPVGWHVRPQCAVVLRSGPKGDSVQEPPLLVAFGSIERYAHRHPSGSEIGLVIDVATDPDALRIDRAGLFRYAHSGIPIACIVNVADRSLEVYSEPSWPSADPGYRRFETLRPG
jgi:hypothetical protein